MVKKTRKIRGGYSLFGKKKSTRRSSSKKRSIEKRKKNLKEINKGKQFDKLKEGKCLAQYQRCMNVSRRKSH